MSKDPCTVPGENGASPPPSTNTAPWSGRGTTAYDTGTLTVCASDSNRTNPCCTPEWASGGTETAALTCADEPGGTTTAAESVHTPSHGI